MSSEPVSPSALRVSCRAKNTLSLLTATPTLNLLSMLLDHTPLDRSMPRSFTRIGGAKVLPWSLEDA